MKRIRMTIALTATMLFAQLATAQMMGGSGNHNPGTGNNGNMNGNMNGGMGSMGAGMGRSLVVAGDGTLYTLRTSPASTTQAPAVDVVAMLPSGAQAWSTKVDGRMTRLELAGTLVLVATGSGDMGMDGSFGAADNASRLIALSVGSGSPQWALDLDGHVASLEPFAGGVYALLVRHTGTAPGSGMNSGANGMASMKRSLAAIEGTGKVLWTIDLN